jgi:hypothetical protein
VNVTDIKMTIRFLFGIDVEMFFVRVAVWSNITLLMRFADILSP